MATSLCASPECSEPVARRSATGPIPDYCSPRCRQRAQYLRGRENVALKRRERLIERREQVVRTCLRCGDPISASRTLKALYCSAKCGRAANRDTLSRVCTETDCERPVRARGICHMHYRRAARADGREVSPAWSERRRANWKRRYALTRGASDAEAFDYKTVFERDGWICGICAHPVDPEIQWPDPMSASLDHVVPVSLGGPHRPENAQCAHLICNVRKGAAA